MNYKKPKATLLHATPLAISEIAGRVCYDSFQLSENEGIKEFKQTLSLPTPDIEESKLIDNLVNVYFHESTVEHINLSYYIRDISREIIIEANRHRIGIATSQKSSRYTIEKMINSWIEYSEKLDKESYQNFVNIIGENIVHENKDMIKLEADKISQMLFLYHKEEPLQKGLTGGAKKKQNDRVKRCLPESWMLEGVWTFNLRALKHFVELRSSGSAYYGIRELTEEILRVTPHKYKILIDKKYKKEFEKGVE